MRAFRFRLDPVMRLKRHKIEEKEIEIHQVEEQIQRLLDEIDEGRAAVQAMRLRLLDEVSDDRLVEQERALDYFRAYMQRVEAEKRSEIETLREQLQKKREELVSLYQEEKILERLRERREEEWKARALKEEAIMLDEIGNQKFNHRRRETGAVLLYLIVPIALAGAAAGLGWYTGVINQETLSRIPLPMFQLVEDATPVAPAPARPEFETVTLRDLVGADLDDDMPMLVQNLMRERERMNEREAELRDREEALRRQQEMIDLREEQISDVVRSVSDELTELVELRRLREEREQSEQAEQEENLSRRIAGMKAKDSATLLMELYRSVAIPDPEEVRVRQLRVIRVLRRMQERAQTELLGALTKADPVTAAEIANDMLELTTEELYRLQPQARAADAAAEEPIDPELPLPELVEEPPIGDIVPPAGE